ncbi:hypothetical protein [Rhizobium rhizogenes]|uniref:DUF4376 domain-containing protein n=1 Tax=Rhizobium rhizogenes TaxID=359 RepID=UPI0022C96160|nr:hypothetical protein [Rhizobium rhizogenes]MCZ7488163.1 hypothetical protein [Rhizobium rhizogenes]
MMYNPYDWYWSASDGRIFSSLRGSIVKKTDPAFKAWQDVHGGPTGWPLDLSGEQTEVALHETLLQYGIIMSSNELETCKKRKTSKITEACASAIVGGYSSDALGSSHTYPSKQTDQLNMMGSVTDALTPGKPVNWRTPFWCSDNGAWEFRMHSAEQIISAGQAGKAHVVECQTKLTDLISQIGAASSIAEVDAINWTE